MYASEPRKPSSSPAKATNTTDRRSSLLCAASARATSIAIDGPEALSFAAGNTVPFGSVPTPSR